VCGAVPPVDLVGFTLVVEPALAAGHAMKVDDDMHALGDGVLGDLGEVVELLAGVVVVALDGGHESPVTERNSNKVDPVAGKDVDIVLGDELLVTLFEQLAALLLAEDRPETVFVDGGRSTVVIKESGINSFLLAEPTAEIDAVGFERISSYKRCSLIVRLLNRLLGNRFGLVCKCLQNTDEGARRLVGNLEDVVRPLGEVGGCSWGHERACQRNGAEKDGRDLHDNDQLVADRR
jgi:hypothetical protein